MPNFWGLGDPFPQGFCFHIVHVYTRQRVRTPLYLLTRCIVWWSYIVYDKPVLEISVVKYSVVYIDKPALKKHVILTYMDKPAHVTYKCIDDNRYCQLVVYVTYKCIDDKVIINVVHYQQV